MIKFVNRDKSNSYAWLIMNRSPKPTADYKFKDSGEIAGKTAQTWELFAFVKEEAAGMTLVRTPTIV